MRSRSDLRIYREVLTASTGRSRAGGIEASGLTAHGRRSEPPSDTVDKQRSADRTVWLRRVSFQPLLPVSKTDRVTVNCPNVVQQSHCPADRTIGASVLPTQLAVGRQHLTQIVSNQVAT